MNNFEIIKNKKNIYWVRHAESCANISIDLREKIKHPSLTNLGINQAITLGIEFINKLSDKESFFFIKKGFSSPLARTIMTGLLAMRTYSYKVYKNFEIVIVHYISEVLNSASILDLDYQNKVVPPLKLKLMINLIKDWLEHFWLIEYDDIEFNEILEKIRLGNLVKLNNIEEDQRRLSILETINNIYEIKKTNFEKNDMHIQIRLLCRLIKNDELLKFTDPKFLRGPKVNTDFYSKKYNEVLNQEYYKLGKPPIKNFYLIDYDLEDIICFSHGMILKENFKDKLVSISELLHDGKLINTSLIHEDDEGKIFPLYPLVDSNFYKIKSKISSKDICFQENSFNKAINKIAEFDDNIINQNTGIFSMFYPSDNYSLGNVASNIGSITTEYQSEITLATLVNQLSLKDIYQNKYIKYKNKYLSLKYLKSHNKKY